eukprot:CAMPEP_0197048620 /NCGR_PEP_ID=MMETSP1384-20130603/23933_1 /TAXON_ID=29189 /ORGANISM="Ammonia sp." /LENGTH=293 /DNA_ID=CAMNT_0042480779 /DNA_START=216 /DNA_END=1097 /DNA_ORIENTATION=+
MTHLSRRAFNQQTTSMKNVYSTIRHHPNSGLKVLGLGGAVALGGYVAYSLSRPAMYVPSETRDLMSAVGGPAFAKTVRNRIAKTYGYLCGSVVLTGATTFLLISRGMLGRILSFNPLVFSIGTLVCTFGAIHATMGIDYHESPFAKHLAWAATNGLVGLSLVGLCGIAGGAIVQQAALITGCIIGGMSTAAMVSPSDTFLRMGPYLGVGLGVVIAASLGGMFFPGSTLLMNVSLYGGLGLFGLYAAHDAQRVLHDAQVAGRFDPVSEQMGLYLDSINIFVRVVQILMMQQRRK